MSIPGFEVAQLNRELSLPTFTPLYRITPLTLDRSHTWRESPPIDVSREHVPLVCQALRRAGVSRARVKLIPEVEDLLPQLADHRLPALMRRQCA